jgi:hypothetical protein
MKLRIFLAVLLVAGAWVAGRRLMVRGWGGDGGERPGVVSKSPSDARGGERVIDESYRLEPGALVEVSGINGPVEVATTEGDTAEVRVVVNADQAEDLENSRIKIEHNAKHLVVQARSGRRGGFFRWLAGRGGGVVRQSVTLKLPRRVELRASGINGHVRVGALEGGLRVSGVNGGVDLAGASESSEVSGVNGSVTLRLASLSGEGADVSGVNGSVEVFVAPGLNADVRVSGTAGGVDVALPNVTVEEERRSHFAGRIGAGGPAIKVSGVRGGVRFANN